MGSALATLDWARGRGRVASELLAAPSCEGKRGRGQGSPLADRSRRAACVQAAAPAMPRPSIGLRLWCRLGLQGSRGLARRRSRRRTPSPHSSTACSCLWLLCALPCQTAGCGGHCHADGRLHRGPGRGGVRGWRRGQSGGAVSPRVRAVGVAATQHVGRLIQAAYPDLNHGLAAPTANFER
jgi:hypothetical protein